jgi:hypothetical protein
MVESPLPNEVSTEKKVSKFPLWLLFAIPVLLVGVCCVVLAVVVKPFFNLNVQSGGYSIESVTLSTGLEDGQPIGIKDIFLPSDKIICTVKTSGVDGGIIGMRWYLNDEMIYEQAGKTVNNTIGTFIQGDGSKLLPQGKYRVEIFITEEALETVYFEVKTIAP